MKNLALVLFGSALALSAIFESPCVSAAETVTYYYTNEQGTPLATTSANGTILTSVDHHPYGAQALGSPAEGPGYTGHINDADAGLIYMQARYYDPGIGRFITADPLGPSVADPFNFNRFAYADNNPVKNIDPDGKQATLGMPSEAVHLTQAEGDQLARFIVPGYECATQGCGAGSWIGEVAGVLPIGKVSKVVKAVKEVSEASRAGKVFTRAGKAEVKAANMAKNEGKLICEHCKTETVPAKKSEKGVTPPKNEAHVDHIEAMSKGGEGSPSNGQILCGECNIKKSDN
ncbi:RHS repeat-associated core domain-containing protein [Pinirhizobacter soli]|uniref:RHS repeat-associated core domain-containing protein n=1 Tax=Pinirhizobacter soli TaxID=2786953 RepID=UPI00202AB39C|nr:RHS repeat-associated core domain-containing protein [Pinirhizobacter soli]